jgi:hypothetical protein
VERSAVTSMGIARGVGVHERPPFWEKSLKLKIRYFWENDPTFKILATPLISVWVPGSNPARTHSSYNRESNSLWQCRFSPGAPVSSYITMHCKLPIIVYRPHDVQSKWTLCSRLIIFINRCTWSETNASLSLAVFGLSASLSLQLSVSNFMTCQPRQ